jgi:hypothetical protein
MMFLIQQLCNFALIVDGSALASTLRSDLAAMNLKYGAEITKYAKDGLDIMISNKWFEQPPQVIEHEVLAGL